MVLEKKNWFLKHKNGSRLVVTSSLLAVSRSARRSRCLFQVQLAVADGLRSKSEKSQNLKQTCILFKRPCCSQHVGAAPEDKDRRALARQGSSDPGLPFEQDTVRVLLYTVLAPSYVSNLPYITDMGGPSSPLLCLKSSQIPPSKSPINVRLFVRPQVSVLLLQLHNKGARKYPQQLNLQNFPAALCFSRMYDIKNRLNSRGSSNVHSEKDFKHHSLKQPLRVTQVQQWCGETPSLAKHIYKLMGGKTLQREGKDSRLKRPEPSLWFQIKEKVRPD